MTSTLDKLRAILWRDLLTAIRYRSGFVLSLVGILIELAAFYFLSRAIGPGFRPDGVEYFPFLLVGTGIYTFFVMSAQAFLNAVQEAQQTGTLEVLMTTPTPAVELLTLSAISAFAGNVFNLFVYFIAGITIFRAAVHPNFLSCFLVLIFCVAIALALGLVAAMLQVALQKGSSLLWLIGSALWLLSGTTFPIQTLPRPLEMLGRAIPFSYAIDGMRMALLDGQSIRAMAPTLAALAAFSVVLVPLALAGLSFSLRQARQNGTLSFY